MEITEEMINNRTDVVQRVSNMLGPSAEDIMGRNQQKWISVPRQLVMWALAELYGYTHTQIGELMQRDHSTVCYSIKKMERGFWAVKMDKYKNALRESYYEARDQA